MPGDSLMLRTPLLLGVTSTCSTMSGDSLMLRAPLLLGQSLGSLAIWVAGILVSGISGLEIPIGSGNSAIGNSGIGGVNSGTISGVLEILGVSSNSVGTRSYGNADGTRSSGSLSGNFVGTGSSGNADGTRSSGSLLSGNFVGIGSPGNADGTGSSGSSGSLSGNSVGTVSSGNAGGTKSSGSSGSLYGGSSGNVDRTKSSGSSGSLSGNSARSGSSVSVTGGSVWKSARIRSPLSHTSSLGTIIPCGSLSGNPVAMGTTVMGSADATRTSSPWCMNVSQKFGLKLDPLYRIDAIRSHHLNNSIPIHAIQDGQLPITSLNPSTSLSSQWGGKVGRDRELDGPIMDGVGHEVLNHWRVAEEVSTSIVIVNQKLGQTSLANPDAA
ncbi:uncharacterized protein F5147DRAFT_765336 [Suillus discolor]|uniref:Uncharacterized protein n=1 Tax=Suillus discolor TaxID=1912936 RepID=A0A9P7ERW3_9AGAM|nr:uncharacterized protein F5147DRAFT_765336 [Suillus discolor]KAG2083764.1 hypothetical protein F5147DRAFT_765336 [Suillus discolor]